MKKVGIFKLGGFILAIILAIIGLFAIFKYTAQKRAINLETRVQNALEDIKVAEKNRVDSLQTLADAVKSYANLEKDVHTHIAAARKNIEEANFEEANVNISAAISAIHEAYPTLESSDLYKQYMNEVTICNRDIQANRKTYNTALREYEAYLRDPFWAFVLSGTAYEKVEFVKLSEVLGDNQEMPQINWE